MKTLEHLLADLIVFDFKVRNWHWNVTGDWAYLIHKQTDKLQAKTGEFIDAVGEKIKMRHLLPVANLEAAVALASLQELKPKVFDAVDVCRGVIKDLTAIEETTLAIKADHLSQPLFDEIFLFLDEQRYLFEQNLNQPS